MTTIWLTQEQLNLATEGIRRINTHYDVIEAVVPPFDTFLMEPRTLPVYRSITLLFRRKHAHSSEFELDTPVQICDEWLAKQMQMR
jgi:hypothetical protein